MGLRERLVNALTKGKTTNRVDGNAFLKYGNRRDLAGDWSQVQMQDEDIYKGYPYAIIQKRANKVASLARENLTTWVNRETQEEFDKREVEVIHPYLKLIEDSTDFSVKQFWKTICIYLDLAGAYYLAAVRNKIPSKSPLAPDIYGDVQKFILLNPYEVKRYFDKDMNLVGYVETKPDGRQREWPVHMIISMRELNPFRPETAVWSMTDAAKESVYTLQQSGNLTRETLDGNLSAPGIISTDVILDDETFENFRARIVQHQKGEPLFGNGAGAIKWESMQTDLDKAALMDINEINRTTLFAVSGTSKTSLGIEQSGTTRETARVQVEQFISDTAQPRLEDIVDALNLDYKKYYPREYKASESWIEIKSAAARDYQTETQATAMRQSQSALAFDLMQKGYTMESAYDYAEGKIDLSELQLKSGLEEPQAPEDGDGGDDNPEGPKETPPQDDVEASSSEDSGQDDSNSVPDNDTENSLSNLEGLEPHAELVANGKGKGNWGHAGRPGKVGGSSAKGVKAGTVRHQTYKSGDADSQFVAEWDETNDPIYPDEIIVKSEDQIGHIISSDSASKAKTAYTIRDKRVLHPFRDLDPNDELDRHDIGLYRDYMKATFKLDDKELDRLLDNTGKRQISNTVETNTDNFLGRLEGLELHTNLLDGAHTASVARKVASEMDINLEIAKADLDGDRTSECERFYKLVAEELGISELDSDDKLEADPEFMAEVYRRLHRSDKNTGLAQNENKGNENGVKCTCDYAGDKVEKLANQLSKADGETLKESYQSFLDDLLEIQNETYKACVSKLTINAFSEDDIIGKIKRKTILNKLKAVIQKYWWILTPLLANSVLDERNQEYGEDVKFVFTNALQKKVEDNASKVAEGHLGTILKDILSTANKAFTDVTEKKAAELIVKAYKSNTPKFVKYFEEQPTMTEALKAIRNTDILEENRKIYERANELALQGYSREQIIKAVRNEYKQVSEERAALIAQNETARAYGHTQYEADYQFLNSIGQLDTAMKQWVSLRPDNEKDKICPLCQYLIDLGPIPFTQNFLSLGDTLSIDNDGKTFNYICNYENIQSSTAHPRCLCTYRLILNGKTLNELSSVEPDSDGGSDVGSSYNSFSDDPAKSVNGGKGSGNFGHAGRPGMVGGSSKTGELANPETKVTSDWLDKHREIVKARGFTDEWIDASVRDLRRRELKEKGLKAKTTEAFDKIVEQMKADGQDYTTWMETVGKAHRTRLAELEEMRAGFDKEAQAMAVENLEKTGIVMRSADKKWLREQCPAELINGVTESMREAERNGLNLKETEVKFTPATRKGGSCTWDPKTNNVKIALTRDWMLDVDSAKARAGKKGPDGERWWTNGKLNTASSHECGHAMVWQVIKNQNLSPYAYDRFCFKVVEQANDIFARNSGKDYWEARRDLTRNEGKQYLSSYGRTNAMETIAESYNNPNYSEYTKIVNNLVRDALKGKTQWTT